MKDIILTTHAFKNLIQSQTLLLFEEELQMDIADDLLKDFDFILISPEDKVFGVKNKDYKFIKHKSYAFQMAKKVLRVG